MRRGSFLLVLIAPMFIVGCSRGSGGVIDDGGAPDGGTIIRDDSGSGIMILTDSGGRDARNTPILPDSGSPRPDSGSTGMRDAGSSPACPPQRFPHPEAPGCAASTLSCLEESRDVEMCVGADPDAAGCEQCFQAETLACASDNGCDDEFGNFYCCVMAECTSPTPACIQAAAMGACAAQSGAVQSCVSDVATMGLCNPAACFPEG